jgi:hypothetical protein
VIPSVFLTVNRSRHCTGLSFWVRRWFFRKKPPRQNFHVSDPPFFFLILNFPSVIRSVTTDGQYPLVVTDWITDGKILSVILTSNCRHKYSVGKSVAIKQISGSDYNSRPRKIK